MSKIKLSLDYTPVNGKQISFLAPCSSSDAECLVINDVNFDIVDADGVKVAGSENIWNRDAMVSVILDTINAKAYIQNANSNAYLEAQLATKMSKTGTAVAPVSADKTLEEADVGKFLRVDAAATITVPADIFPEGAELEVFRNTHDAVTITSSGVLFAVPGNTDLVTDNQTISDQYASIVLKHIADNVWSVQGAI